MDKIIKAADVSIGEPISPPVWELKETGGTVEGYREAWHSVGRYLDEWERLAVEDAKSDNLTLRQISRGVVMAMGRLRDFMKLQEEVFGIGDSRPRT